MEKKPETEQDTRTEPLASEIYRDLKAELRFKNWLIVGLVGVIAAICFYHNWLWAQFDTITVDAGGGYSNYVTGENTGGVHNGTNQSPTEAGRQG